MKKLILSLSLVLIAFVSGCGKTPEGLLGKCDQEVPGIISYPGQKYCSDYSFVTTSSRDLKADALAAAKASCGSGTWTDNEACSTTLGTTAGYCKFSISQAAGSDTFTLNYRAVFGPALLGAASALQTWCEAMNQPPLSATWSTTP